MKSVIKGDEPKSFRKWKQNTNPDWQPRYGNLQNPEKRELHAALLEEQGFVCCYCGRGIDFDDSHIEHYRPQEMREDLALDYANLHASCIRETRPGMPLHCGHRKGERFDENWCISPLDKGCEQHFRYTLGGGVESLSEAAGYMVDLLGLDIKFLCNRREEVLKGVFDDEFLNSATFNELETIRDGFRRMTKNHLPGLGHVVARYAEQLLMDKMKL